MIGHFPCCAVSLIVASCIHTDTSSCATEIFSYFSVVTTHTVWLTALTSKCDQRKNMLQNQWSYTQSNSNRSGSSSCAGDQGEGSCGLCTDVHRPTAVVRFRSECKRLPGGMANAETEWNMRSHSKLQSPTVPQSASKQSASKKKKILWTQGRWWRIWTASLSSTLICIFFSFITRHVCLIKLWWDVIHVEGMRVGFFCSWETTSKSPTTFVVRSQRLLWQLNNVIVELSACIFTFCEFLFFLMYIVRRHIFCFGQVKYVTVSELI